MRAKSGRPHVVKQDITLLSTKMSLTGPRGMPTERGRFRGPSNP